MDSQAKAKVIHTPSALFHSKINDLALCDRHQARSTWNAFNHSNLIKWCPIKTFICLKVWKRYKWWKLSELLKKLSYLFPRTSAFLALLFEGIFFFFLHKADSCLLQFLFLLVVISLFHTSVSWTLTCHQGNNLAKRSADVAIRMRKGFKNININLRNWARS